MSIIFSRQCEYALQAVLYLALQPPEKMTSTRDLTRRLGTPYHFLAKILQGLTRKGLLTSLKGPTGGFALAVPAREITLFHIVEAIDGADFMKTCVLGFPTCSGTSPCSVHHSWGNLREEIYHMLVGKTIDELARTMKKPEYKKG